MAFCRRDSVVPLQYVVAQPVDRFSSVPIVHFPVPAVVVVPSGQEDAEKAYKAQWEHFAVDNIHQSADVQLDQETEPFGSPSTIGSSWGLKPT